MFILRGIEIFRFCRRESPENPSMKKGAVGKNTAPFFIEEFTGFDVAKTKNLNAPQYKCALITGASSGLGRALCLELAKQNVALILVARDLTQLQALAAELPPTTRAHQCDLASQEERARLITLIDEFVPDLVINNAGFGLYGPILSHPLSEFQDMLAVNAATVMELSIASARALQKKGLTGTILNISSAAAFFPFPTFCVYAATKAFVNQFSLGFDEEMKPYGIRVLTSCPGQIDTPFRKKAALHFPQQTNSFTLSQQNAVQLILKQIKKGKQLQIIDWRYRIGVFFGKCLPRKLRNALLTRSLRARYPSSYF